MSITEIREQLHKYIDVANDNDVAAMYSFMEDKSVAPHAYSDDELSEFYSRRNRFIQGGSKGYSVEEVHNQIRHGNSEV